jgi:branched-chain amino acid transport system permease protein
MRTLNDIVIPALVNGSLYALVALGFSLLERSTRILNFAHGDVIMWAAMAPIVVGVLWGAPGWLALLSGLAAAVLIGLAIERTAMRPFIGRGDDFTWILATLGASIILQQLAAEPFDGQDQAFPYHLSRDPLLDALDVSGQDLLVIGGALLCAALIYGMSERTSLGRRLSAVGTDPEGAIALGISPGRMSRAAMLLAAVTATVAGITIAPLLLVSPHFGFSLTFTGFVAAAIGGLGSLAGAFAGGYAVGLIIQITAVHIGTDWTNTMLFGSLLVLYLVRPQGLFGHAAARRV